MLKHNNNNNNNLFYFYFNAEVLLAELLDEVDLATLSADSI